MINEVTSSFRWTTRAFRNNDVSSFEIHETGTLLTGPHAISDREVATANAHKTDWVRESKGQHSYQFISAWKLKRISRIIAHSVWGHANPPDDRDIEFRRSVTFLASRSSCHFKQIHSHCPVNKIWYWFCAMSWRFSPVNLRTGTGSPVRIRTCPEQRHNSPVKTKKAPEVKQKPDG